MSTRLHTAKVYKVEYATAIGSHLTDKIIDICKNSSGWVSEDETDMEIPLADLEEVIEETTDVELKEALQSIYDECDKSNDFARLALY